jgi:hypothetical protein
MMSYAERLPIYPEPQIAEKPAFTVGFGESLGRYAEYPVVNEDGIRFVRVLLRNNLSGWAPLDGLIEDGKLAVCREYIQAYPSPGERMDRNMTLLLAGEPLIIETIDDPWVRVVTRDGEKRVWINESGKLSIDPFDVEIGIRLHEALREPNNRKRIALLEAIRQMPAYGRSALSAAVEARLEMERGGKRR